MNFGRLYLNFVNVISVEGGKWSEWSNWTACSVTCGNGTRERTRYCQGGIAGSVGCTGNTTETSTCNKNPCIGKYLGI